MHQTVKPDKKFLTGWSGIGFPVILAPCPLTRAVQTRPVLESLEEKIATLPPCFLTPPPGLSTPGLSHPLPLPHDGQDSPPRRSFTASRASHPQHAINHVIPALTRFWKVVVLSCYLEVGMLVGNNNLGWVFAAGRWNSGWQITSFLPNNLLATLTLKLDIGSL